MNAYGGLQIADNSTATIVGAAAAKHTQGWAAVAASQHGAQDIVASAANSRLTLQPGVYMVAFGLSIETEDISGTSGDDVGDVTGQLYVGGVALAGTKVTARLGGDDSQPDVLSLPPFPVEITEAQKTAGTNYVEIWLKSGDASGNDVTVSQGQFTATRVR